MFRPGGFSDIEEDTDSGLEAPLSPRVTGQNDDGGDDDPGHQNQVVEEEEKTSRSVLFDLAQSVEAGDLDSVGGRTAPGD